MKVRGKVVNLDLDYITHRPKITLEIKSDQVSLPDRFVLFKF